MDKINTAVCCIVKDEPIHYLREFISHHLSIGFDKIFIYDNNDKNDEYLVLKKEFLNYIDIIKFQGKCKQFEAYRDCTVKNKNNYDWIAYIDSDEFIEIERNSIKDILYKIKAPALGLNWQIFASGEYDGHSQITSFTKATHLFSEYNKHIKVIANPKEIEYIDNPHNFKFKEGKKAITILDNEIDTFFTDFPIKRLAWINHYYCRTKKDMERKVRRGRADSENPYDNNIFNGIDENTHIETHAIELESQRAKRIALITPTGNRKFQIDLCYKYMDRQNFTGIVDWYIIDDCIPFTTDFIKQNYIRSNWNIHIIHPTPYWKEGDNTQGRNLLVGINAIKESNINYDGVFFIEDDDWYSPNYLFEMTKRLENFDIVGTIKALYWNIPSNITERCNNTNHASLCQTVINPIILDDMVEVIKMGNKYFDMDLYRLSKEKGRKINLFKPETEICIGIKGLNGRKGIGGFHEVEIKNPLIRITNDNIKSIIFNDYYNYILDILSPLKG